MAYQKHLRASVSKALGCHFCHIPKKSRKVGTTIPCGSGVENQGFKDSRFAFFMISMCIFSGPPFLLTCFEFLSDVLHFCVDFRSPFHLNSARFLLLFSRPQKIKRLDYMRSWGEGICGTSQIRGELGGIWAKGGPEEDLKEIVPKHMCFSVESGASDRFACTRAT